MESGVVARVPALSRSGSIDECCKHLVAYDVGLCFDINEAVVGYVQVLAIYVLPHTAKIMPLEFGLRLVKRTRLEARDDMVHINKELNLGREG
jgi:hypothetical protein